MFLFFFFPPSNTHLSKCTTIQFNGEYNPPSSFYSRGQLPSLDSGWAVSLAGGSVGFWPPQSGAWQLAPPPLPPPPSCLTSWTLCPWQGHTTSSIISLPSHPFWPQSYPCPTLVSLTYLKRSTCFQTGQKDCFPCRYHARPLSSIAKLRVGQSMATASQLPPALLVG